MDTRKRNYIILALTIAVLFIVLQITKALGITIQTGLVNAVITVAFYLPIVAFLFYLSGDIRLAKPWRIILRILSVQMALANIVGIIIFWLT